jgi:RNA polymerase sigma factor FliA
VTLRLVPPRPPRERSTDRDAAIAQWAPLVKHVVGRLSIRLPAVLDYEDMVGYGTIGLIQALDRFDGSKGIKFQSYAMSRIRGAIIDAFRSLDPLPRPLRQTAKKLASTTAELTSTNGREPTHAEVAHAMDMTMAEYNRAVTDSSWSTVSLDGLVDENNEHASPRGLPADDTQEDFTLQLERLQTLTALSSAIACLPERETLIVSLYYRDRLTMREISQILDISESRVCQLHARALSRLRLRLAPDRAA